MRKDTTFSYAYHGTVQLFDKFDLNHVLEREWQVKSQILLPYSLANIKSRQ